MDDLHTETMEVLASLSEEQLLLVLAYARCLKDAPNVVVGHGLEDLLEEPA